MLTSYYDQAPLDEYGILYLIHTFTVVHKCILKLTSLFENFRFD